MAKKGRETKVHFTFVKDKFASVRPLNLLIIHFISSTSWLYNSPFFKSQIARIRNRFFIFHSHSKYKNKIDIVIIITETQKTQKSTKNMVKNHLDHHMLHNIEEGY